MKQFQILIGALLSYALMTYPASALAQTAYRGSDAGYLVYSVGTILIPMNFSFLYRKFPSDSEPKWKGTMECNCIQVHWSKPESYPNGIDYSGRESGFVFAKRLPPGQYEIYDIGINGTNIVSSIHWSLKKPLSIPFKIEPGKTTYIGNFARGCWCNRSNSVADHLGYFVISDKSVRDVAIARTKESAISDVNVDVWDATKLDSPILFTQEPN